MIISINQDKSMFNTENTSTLYFNSAWGSLHYRSTLTTKQQQGGGVGAKYPAPSRPLWTSDRSQGWQGSNQYCPTLRYCTAHTGTLYRPAQPVAFLPFLPNSQNMKILFTKSFKFFLVDFMVVELPSDLKNFLLENSLPILRLNNILYYLLYFIKI